MQPQQKAILLRSRSKPGDSNASQYHSIDCPEKLSQSPAAVTKSPSEKNSVKFGRSMSKNSSNRERLKCSIGVYVLFVFFLLVLMIGAYMHSIFEQGTLLGRDHSGIVNGKLQIQTWRVWNDSMEDPEKVANTTNNETLAWSNILSTAIPPYPQPRKFPLVDRAILDKLDRIHGLPLSDNPQTAPARWPPRITHIPERHRPGSPKTAESPCESPTHRRACRFLLPLRIADKGSKAQTHFLQLFHLARSLNRTLVLPNIGKSKIGACFKWEFNAYYDESSLGNNEWFIRQDKFRDWMNDRGRNMPLKAQLVAISSELPSTHTKVLQLEPTYVNQDVDAHVYNIYGAWQTDLPGCFSTKFQRLEVGNLSAFMSVKMSSNGRRDINSKPVGDSILDALSAIASKSFPNSPDNEPPVIIVNWDLRHPISTTSFANPMSTLPYSTAIINLAERLAPISPYLAIHWEMEAIEPETLLECAHALVDVLSRILHEEEYSNPENVALASKNITTRTIWFVSDYPYPIARRPPTQARPAIVAKSGTFKDFEVRHEEAVDILRSAFNDEHGELRNWKLTDLVEGVELERFKKGSDEEALLQDSGVSDILNRLISTKAAIFVSGTSRCGRKSSFTKEVVDAREGAWVRSKATYLRNIVNTFG